MKHRSSEHLLREYVRNSLLLKETESGGNPYISDYGGYGISYGSGQDLMDTFITPFTDIFKTALGKSKEITRKARTVIWVGLQTVLTTLIPIYGYDYAEVFDKEKEDINKIREQYKDVYERTNQALKSNDAALLAFMVSPANVLALGAGAAAAKATPKATKELLSVMSGGLSDELIDGIKSKAEKAGRWALGDSHGSGGRSGKKGNEPKDRFEGQIREEDEGEKKPMLTLDKVLKDRKFLNKVFSSQKAQQMQAEATEIYKGTLQEILSKAENLMKKTRTIEDVEKAMKGKLKGDMQQKIDEIKKLSPEEKKKAEEMLISGLKKATKEFYVKNLSDHVKKVMEAGIPDSSPYVKDYKATIQKIQSL